MKPGGTLWLTAPFFYVEHERPYDYFRYTRYGLRFLLKQADFRVRELEWLEGYLGTLGYQAQLVGRHLPHTRADYGGGARGLALAGVAKLARRLSAVRRASGCRRSTSGFASSGRGCRRTTAWSRASRARTPSAEPR